MENPQIAALDKLVSLGYAIRHVHSDGVIDVCRDLEIGTDGSGKPITERISIFVKADGTIRPPRSVGTMIAGAELHEAGIKPVSA